LEYPPNRSFKNENFCKKKSWFLNDLLGVFQNKSFLQGVNQKKKITGRKSEITYITGSKTLLTLFQLIETF